MVRTFVAATIVTELRSGTALPLSAQSVLNIAAGEQQTDGSYLWVYKVYAREYQDLNFWNLGVDRPV